MSKTLSKGNENMMKIRRPEIDQNIRGHLRSFAYPTRPLRLPYALVSRSKGNGKGRRRVGVWQAKGGEYILKAY